MKFFFFHLHLTLTFLTCVLYFYVYFSFNLQCNVRHCFSRNKKGNKQTNNSEIATNILTMFSSRSSPMSFPCFCYLILSINRNIQYNTNTSEQISNKSRYLIQNIVHLSSRCTCMHLFSSYILYSNKNWLIQTFTIQFSCLFSC